MYNIYFEIISVLNAMVLNGSHHATAFPIITKLCFYREISSLMAQTNHYSPPSKFQAKKDNNLTKDISSIIRYVDISVSL